MRAALPALPLHAFDRERRSQRCDDDIELAQIADFDVDKSFKKIWLAIEELEIQDVPTCSANQCRKRAQSTWLIAQDDAQSPNVRCFCAGFPTHFQPALGLIVEVHKVVAVNGVAGDPSYIVKALQVHASLTMTLRRYVDPFGLRAMSAAELTGV